MSLSASIRLTVPKPVPNEVIDEVLELLMDLDASDEQLDCPFPLCVRKIRSCGS